MQCNLGICSLVQRLYISVHILNSALLGQWWVWIERAIEKPPAVDHLIVPLDLAPKNFGRGSSFLCYSCIFCFCRKIQKQYGKVQVVVYQIYWMHLPLCCLVVSVKFFTELLNCIVPEIKIVLHRKYLRCLHKTSTIIVVTILSAINQAKFHLLSTIISRISLFMHVIYSSADLHC